MANAGRKGGFKGPSKGKRKRSAKFSKKDITKGRAIAPTAFMGMKTDIRPTKFGNVFDLPMGATLTIRDGQFSKKDRLTCVLVPPNKRTSFCPNLALHDKLVSRMYVINSNFPFKSPVEVCLPCLLEDTSVHVSALYKHKHDWTERESEHKESGVRFTMPETGTVVLMWTPLKISFPITVNGALLHASGNSYIQLRVPRMSCPYSLNVNLQVIGINKDRILAGRKYKQREMMDIEEISQFFEFDAPANYEFKRTATLRLPLPDWAEGDVIDPTSSACLMVAVKYNEVWEVLERPLKFTGNTVSFETCQLGKFCMVKPKEGRRNRVKLAMPFLEEANHSIRGEILAFILLESNTWYIWVECVREENVISVILEKIEKGFTLIQRDSAVADVTNKMKRRRSVVEANKNMEFVNGYMYNISVVGDIVMSDETTSTIDVLGSKSSEGSLSAGTLLDEVCMQYHEFLPDTYRVFETQPAKGLDEVVRMELLQKKQISTQNANRIKKTISPVEKTDQDVTSKGKLFNTSNTELCPAINSEIDDCSRVDVGCSTDKESGDPSTNNISMHAEFQPDLELAKEPCEINRSMNEEPGVFGINNNTEVTDFMTKGFQSKLIIRLSSKTINRGNSRTPGSNLFAHEKSEGNTTMIYTFKVPFDSVRKYYNIPDISPVEAEALPKSIQDKEKVFRISVQQDSISVPKPMYSPADSELDVEFELSDDESTMMEDCRVLCARSLRVISEEIQEGLTLSVHLGLSEAAITSIGFDCLQEGADLTKLTFRSLTYWKRNNGDDRKTMVQKLISSLQLMGENALAMVIQELNQINVAATHEFMDQYLRSFN